MLEPQTSGIPLPVPSAVSAPYWEGCRDGEVRYQRCSQCGRVSPVVSYVCPWCRSATLVWRASAGRGRLYSWTVVWRPQQPGFAVPYAPAIVDMEEGFRVLSCVVGCEPEDLRPDMSLAVELHRADERITLPFFRPAH